MQAYPELASQQTRWIRALRGQPNPLDYEAGCTALSEIEALGEGRTVTTNVIFPVNSECTYTCVMCDLWKNALPGKTPPGAVKLQIAKALATLPTARWVKIYNAGSFFDTGAIPIDDYEQIATLLRSYERVIVESHPAFIGERVLKLRDYLCGRLEVAMGLETVHEPTLQKLNKRCTLSQFEQAARFLHSNNIDLRVFIIARPPFQTENQAVTWGQKSLEFANSLSARASILIPGRAGNGAMDELQRIGDFSPPHIKTVEHLLQYGLSLAGSRVYVDTWSPSWRMNCKCDDKRVMRIHAMNRLQAVVDPINCRCCNAGDLWCNEGP